MNLFVVAWNVPVARHVAISTALQQVAALYPQLALDERWEHTSPLGALFAASVQTARNSVSPRTYVAESGSGIVLYSGFPVCPHDAFPAHRAEALAEHWDALQSQLDGQYFTARLTDSPPSLEIQTDLLGMEQVYYAREGRGWLLSNSVHLIEAAMGESQPLDPLGVSLYLSIGWAGADRTLRRDIKVIPAAQRWTWQPGSESPTCRTYAPMSAWLTSSRGERPDSVVDRLSGELLELCHAVSNSFGVVECPLTAGRDSRLLAVLLTHEQLPAHYYTSGNPSSTDVKVGQSIAQRYNLSHRLNAITSENVVSDWDAASRLYVARNDALSSLWQLASTLTMPQQIDQLQVTLWGIGGEIARGFYYEPELFLPGRHSKRAKSVLASKLLLKHGGLLRQETSAISEAYIGEFVDSAALDGFSPVDALDLFYAYQRVGRWAGSNARLTAPVCDHFSPFCSRAWMRATFALSALQRYTEPLHYGLIRRLAPDLMDLPFDKGAWRRQPPLANWLELGGAVLRGRARHLVPQALISAKQRLRPPVKPTRTYEHAGWLETRLEDVRDLCLDQPNSSVWDFVDRGAFERLTSSHAAAAERSPLAPVLFPIVTLFYDQSRRL